MGIRFNCHHCGHELHVKDFQAGKRGRCPDCKDVFRIPVASAEKSLPVDVDASAPSPQSPRSPASQPATTSASVQATEIHPQQSKSNAAISTSGDRASDVANPNDPAQQNPTSNQTTSNNPTPAAPAPVVPQFAAPEPPPPPQPAIFQQGEHVQWYSRSDDGQQFGPTDAATMTRWLFEKRILPNTWIWREGWTDWKLASDALADHFKLASQAPPPPPQAVATTEQAMDHSPAATTSSAPAQPAVNSSAASSPAAATSSSAPNDGPSNSRSLESTSTASPPTATSSLGASSRVVNARVERRLKRKRNHNMMIIMLSVAAIGLAVALVIVLF